MMAFLLSHWDLPQACHASTTLPMRPNLDSACLNHSLQENRPQMFPSACITRCQYESSTFYPEQEWHASDSLGELSTAVLLHIGCVT
jgi:hypothetical protein